MRILKRYLPIAAAALALLSLLGWRFWPRSVYAVAGVKGEAVERIEIYLHRMTYDLTPNIEFSSYYLNTEDVLESMGVLDAIFFDCAFRPSFRNLLPWDDGTITGYSEFSATIFFFWADGKEASCVSIWQPGIASQSMNLYLLSNGATLGHLADYVMTNGTTDTKPIPITP